MRLYGSLALLAAAAIWGGMYVVSRAVMAVVPPFILLEMRLIISSLALGAVVVAARSHRVRVADLPQLAFIGALSMTVSVGMQFLGTHLSSASAGGLITSASPAFIALFAAWLLRERMTRHKLLALALASGGVLLVAWPSSGSLQGPTAGLGNLLLIGAAISWALQTVLSKRATRRYSALTVTWYALVAGTLSTLPLAAWELARQPLPEIPAWAWWGIAYIGLISTSLAFYLWNLGFALLDAGTASLFFFAQPLVAGFLGWLLLGEHLGSGFLAGGVLSAAGVAVASLAPPVADAAIAPAPGEPG